MFTRWHMRRWHIDQDPGYDLTKFGLNLIRTFLECVLAMKLIEETIYSSSIRVFFSCSDRECFSKTMTSRHLNFFKVKNKFRKKSS